MIGWDKHGHACRTGLQADRYLGQGDLQDAENCGYPPVSVLAEMDVDRAHGDPLVQFRDGRIFLIDGTMLERGGTLGCVWAVTGVPVPDHSGVAGEPEATTKEAPQIVVTDPPTRVPAPDPTKPAAAILAGGMVVSDEAVEAAARADHHHGRLALTSDPAWDGLPEVDREWYRAAARAYLAPAAPGIAAQALRSAAAVLVDDDRLEPTGHDDLCGYGPPGECDCCRGRHYRWLIARADELERGTAPALTGATELGANPVSAGEPDAPRKAAQDLSTEETR